MDHARTSARPSAVPEHWLNLAPLVRAEYPLPRHQTEDRPADFDDLAAIYSDECARVELLEGAYGASTQIPIPSEVVEQYRKYRPTPLLRATGLETALGHEGRIFIKREDLNPGGSHKPNTSYAQAYYAFKQGLRGLVTDTGAGQWGASIAMACQAFGLNCTIFMTRDSYTLKPYRRYMMELAGGQVHASPSRITEHGRRALAECPDDRGSLGVGMGEAMELLSTNADRRLALGCMSYHAALHQTVIGQELVDQLADLDCQPDVLVACVGGGSNLFGFVAPYLKLALEGARAPRIIAAESANVPVLTKGEYRYDYADAFRLTPRILMYTLGHDYRPPAIHAGGLRYHGKSPMLSLMVRRGLIEPMAIAQDEAFACGRRLFRCENVLPAPESSHAIAATCRAVEQARQAGRRDDIVVCLSGNGYLDLMGYAQFFSLDGAA